MAKASDQRRQSRDSDLGQGPAITLRLAPDLEKKLEAWIAAKAEPKPSRPQAVRMLLAAALETAPDKPKPVRKDSAERAAGAAFAARAAGEQIDRSLQDAGEPDEVRADRKRRLMKMPGEIKKPPR
jgi:hypothetical protein